MAPQTYVGSTLDGDFTSQKNHWVTRYFVSWPIPWLDGPWNALTLQIVGSVLTCYIQSFRGIDLLQSKLTHRNSGYLYGFSTMSDARFRNTPSRYGISSEKENLFGHWCPTTVGDDNGFWISSRKDNKTARSHGFCLTRFLARHAHVYTRASFQVGSTACVHHLVRSQFVVHSLGYFMKDVCIFSNLFSTF